MNLKFYNDLLNGKYAKINKETRVKILKIMFKNEEFYNDPKFVDYAKEFIDGKENELMYDKITEENFLRLIKERVDFFKDDRRIDIYISRICSRINKSDINYKEKVNELMKKLIDFTNIKGLDVRSVKSDICLAILYGKYIIYNEYDNELLMKWLKINCEEKTVLTRSIGKNNIFNIIMNGFDLSKYIDLCKANRLIHIYCHKCYENNEDISKLLKSMNKEEYDRLKAKYDVYYNKDVSKSIQYLQSHNVKDIVESIKLKINIFGKKYFHSNETIKIDCYLKNIPELTIRVFEINTYEFNQKNIDLLKWISGNDLDGFVPLYQNIKKYSIKSHLLCKEIFEFPELKNDGVYVIELTGNGKQSRSLINKGEIHYVRNITPNGYVYNLLNENNKPYDNEKCFIYMNNKEYLYNKDVDGILIPFPESYQNNKLCLTIKEKNEINGLYHYYSVPLYEGLDKENYNLSIGILINKEHVLLGKHNSKIIIHSLLLLQNKYKCSLQLLNDVNMNIELIYSNGSNNEHINIGKLENDFDLCPYITIDDNLLKIKVRIEGKIKINYKDVVISGEDEIEFNKDCQNNIINPYLQKTLNGYELNILGQNGEIIPNYICNIDFKMCNYNISIQKTLKSDKNGKIILKELNNVKSIIINSKININIPYDYIKYPYQIYCLESNKNQIELPFSNMKSEISYYSLNLIKNGNVIEDCKNNIIIKNQSLIIKGLKEGDYNLNICQYKGDLIIITIKVLNSNTIEYKNYYLYNNSIIEKCDCEEYSLILPPEFLDDKIRIKVDNYNENTNIHILWNYFVNIYDLNKIPLYNDYKNTLDQYHYITKTLNNRKLGDEYIYVVKRKNYQLGNLQKRPTLILHEDKVKQLNIKSTSTNKGSGFNDENVCEEEVCADKCFCANNLRGGGYYGGIKQISEMYPNFLKPCLFSLYNCEVNEDGYIEIMKNSIPYYENGGLFTIINIDNNILSLYNYPVNAINKDVPFRDVRVKDIININKHVTLNREIECKYKDNEINYKDGDEFKIISNLEDVYSLFSSSKKINNDELNKFRFLINWNDLTELEKIEKYNERLCHELNYFIYKKDRNFFNKIILPFINNKLEKSFIDKYLLGYSLDEYILQFNFIKLNTFEKCLLCERIEKEKGKKILNHFKDKLLGEIKNPDEYNRIFDIIFKVFTFIFRLIIVLHQHQHQHQYKNLKQHLNYLVLGLELDLECFVVVV